VPEIEDVQRMIEIMQYLGATIEKIENGHYKIDPSTTKSNKIDQAHANKLRSSILLVGPLLTRFGVVEIGHPGGCVIGKRPIDLFLEGFEALGVEVERNDLQYTFKSKNLKPAEIILPLISVTVTEEMIMLASKISGTTTIVNAAMEPEIVALAEYLNQNGAKISGAGSSVITIEGVKTLSNSKFKVIPDRIEAGTMVMLGLITNSQIKIEDCEPAHLKTLLHLLEKAGAKLKIGQSSIETMPSKLKATDMKTHEYPGIATDLQAPYTVLMTQAQGSCMIHETIYEGRLFFTDILNQMGANIIMCDPHRVIIQGATPLMGRKISSPDLRAGIGLVMAALAAKGETTIDNIYQINRGYENIVERLQKIGADISQVE
jgi:UDP-N-acetylglucosamine 1-carboxyvinyltransferase